MAELEQTAPPVKGYTPLRAAESLAPPDTAADNIAPPPPTKGTIPLIVDRSSSPPPVIGWRPTLVRGQAPPPAAVAEQISTTIKHWIGFTPDWRQPVDPVAPHVELLPPGVKPELPSLMQALIVTAAALISGLVLGGATANHSFEVSFQSVLSGSVLTVFLTACYQFYTYTLKKHRRETRYVRHLTACRDRLRDLRSGQRTSSLVTYPAPDECIIRAEQRGSRLWERSPDDPDWLELRIGLGGVRPVFDIGPMPVAHDPLDSDPLLDKARELIDEFGKDLDDAPLTLPLLSMGVAGVIGAPDTRRDFLRALLVQVATHHPWDAVKIVVFGREADADSLRWVRSLPQTWDDNGEPQFVATDGEAITHWLAWVTAQLEDKLRKYPTGARLMKPSFLLVFADPDLARNLEAQRSSLLLDLVFTQGRTLGAHALFAAEQRHQLPSRCDDWVVLAGTQGRLLNAHAPNQQRVFTPDLLDAAAVERFATAMAKLREPAPAQAP